MHALPYMLPNLIQNNVISRETVHWQQWNPLYSVHFLIFNLLSFSTFCHFRHFVISPWPFICGFIYWWYLWVPGIARLDPQVIHTVTHLHILVSFLTHQTGNVWSCFPDTTGKCSLPDRIGNMSTYLPGRTGNMWTCLPGRTGNM